jgi:hypothetical protein
MGALFLWRNMATAAEIVAAIDLYVSGQLEAGGVQDYMIGSRRITRYPIADILKLRSYYAKQAAASTRGADVTYVKFARPG